ncbi:hypothetical protein IWX90DRAFT_517616 [Phyllosticta citrichinensis]|uniref:Uncharacterized protein n=1 Tax=Phyllosticta citrichinensis TaxID=1130410 RepID=A0ABR1XFD3_9PEZI
MWDNLSILYFIYTTNRLSTNPVHFAAAAAIVPIPLLETSIAFFDLFVLRFAAAPAAIPIPATYYKRTFSSTQTSLPSSSLFAAIILIAVLFIVLLFILKAQPDLIS